MADQVLLAFGRIPNTTSLGLDRAGVETGADGAIIVDANSRTNIPNIYAVGDVSNQFNLTPARSAKATRSPTACSARKLGRSTTPMCRPLSSPARRSVPLA